MIRSLRESYDVIVVGGGINGAGVARDCALRGISCLLLEKNDFSAGTSWASSGMIHGGPRYLLHDKDVTRLACLDSGYIQKIAPHLLFRIPFLYPVYGEAGRSAWRAKLLIEGVEAFFSAYDDFVALKNGKKHTRLSSEETLALEPGIPGKGLVGSITFDEWGIDVPRLCIANVIDAVEHGADAVNHAEVVEVLKAGPAFSGVRLRDTISGEEKTVRGKILVNATGPWSPRFAEMFGAKIRLRGGKGVHLVLDRRLFNMAVVARAIDGREIFILPYENTSIIGTTDDDYFGDLDDQRTTEDEIKYLKEGIEQVFPAAREGRVIYSFSGVRPTLYAREVTEDDLSREHEVVDHEETDGVPGAVSVIGGKLASYRIMAEEVTDRVARKLGVNVACSTHEKPLPGGESVPDVRELAREYGIDPYAVSRLVYRHGARATRILDAIRADPALGAFTCSCEPVTEAEMRYVREHEMARTLSDVRRRTRWASGPCQGTNCLIAGAAEEGAGFGAAVARYLDEWGWNRAAVLDGDQLKQEELFQAVHFCNNAIDVESPSRGC